MPSHLSQIGSPQLNPSRTDVGCQIQDPLVLTELRREQGNLASGVGQPHSQELQQDMHQPCPTLLAYPKIQEPVQSHMDHCDAVILNLQSFITNPTFSDAVIGIL